MKTADGFMNVTAMRDHHYEALCDILGLPKLKTDPLYDRAKSGSRTKNVDGLIRAEFEKQPSAHWAKLLTDAGVMNSMVQGYGDFMNHEHTKAVGRRVCGT